MNVFCLFLLFFFTVSCSSPKEPPLYRFSQTSMGMDCHILIPEPLSSLQKTAIQALIDKTFAEIDAIYNNWNPASEISHLNRLPGQEQFTLSPHLHTFLKRVDQLVHLSEGRFDPTIEPIRKLWKMQLDRGLEPSLTELAAIAPAIGWEKLHFINNTIYKEDGRTQLDLGGIAKGLCVDLLIERLNVLGFSDVFVEWGGEIRATGQHPLKRPWRACVSKLGDQDPAHAIAWIDINNQALATSGDYFQFWTISTASGEKTFTHIFDPKTLRPLEVKIGQVASATLLAPDCVTADGLAKVLMLFDSPDKAKEWLNQIEPIQPGLSSWIITR